MRPKKSKLSNSKEAHHLNRWWAFIFLSTKHIHAKLFFLEKRPDQHYI
ncbi:hypothetical protein FTV88_1244 [Heliorestis convoluta]|uniref:Uncharacterized protein n=1 Tax=Heliorestis convoluta TaxID=356322 RepID=A0A5Q2MZE0_9FIRM|nr:hypothetical protein FTV88_1244 [Heliorestis convoluta]